MIRVELTPVEPADDTEEKRDQGMTLIEVLVAMALFGVLSSLLLGLAISTNHVTQDTRERTGVAEETRTAMERMTREVRQSAGISAVTLPTVAAPDITSFTFWTDFDGDGVVDTNAADPEVLTYRWNRATERLSLTAQTDSGAETRPVLAANVTAFDLELRSSEWAYDTDGNGITTWQELDAKGAPVGNQNATADAPELAHIDLLAVSLTVTDGSGSQTYRTQIDLRNRS
jgi:prepilin-type N-terminal cleavage/methylation domain-containing protein